MCILPFCGAILCFKLWLTPPMGFKARVDAPSPVLCHLHLMDPWIAQAKAWSPFYTLVW